jgi:transposase
MDGRDKIPCSGVDGDLLESQDELPSTLQGKQPMSDTVKAIPTETTIRDDSTATLISFELSQKTWVVTIRRPDSERMSRHSVKAGDLAALTTLLARQRPKAAGVAGAPLRLVTIHEAGLDGFWLHRWLCAQGIESHVVDAASIAAPRRKRRAKSDGIDGETLLRTLAAWRRGEPRVCSMVVPPSAEDEDRRRIVRERDRLVDERTALTNRINGLLVNQGITGYRPLKRDRHTRLEAMRTGDGRPLPVRLQAEIERMLERLELLLRQIRQVEAERDRLLAAAKQAAPTAALALLPMLCAIGPEIAATLALECFTRSFGNRRQIAAFAGLAPTPWRSGSINHEQGVKGGGQPSLRELMIEAAWAWLRYQPDSELSRWFHAKVGSAKGRARRVAIVAVARKLLVALWRYVTQGELPAGAKLKAA